MVSIENDVPIRSKGEISQTALENSKQNWKLSTMIGKNKIKFILPRFLFKKKW